MNKEFGILTIHGMGTQRSDDYDRELRSRLLDEFDDDVKQDVRFQAIFYQDLIQPQQNKVWNNMSKQEIDWRNLRKFLLFYLSDVATYQYHPVAENSVYLKVHRRIAETIDALHDDLGNQDAPVVIIAHSLGCHIISNHIWDAQAGKGIWENEAPIEFQKLGTARFLFTTGCSIPLFVAGFDEVAAINKPNEDFQWMNYYDRDDVLGWPLKPLSSSYHNTVTQDVEINVGPWLEPWVHMTPLSHLKYWEDGDFIKPIAEKIAGLHAGL